MILRFVIPGCPQPKQRARRGKGGRWYTPGETRAYEALVGWWATHAASRFRVWPLDATYRVTCDLYMPDRRARDADNVLKAILDGANTVLWLDDRQVAETTVRKALDRDNPRVEVTVEVLA